MIRRLSIDMLNYAIEVVLPPHKRQPIRSAFIKGLIYPLQQDSDAYNTWVSDSIIKATVTGQTGSLQWYLNYLFACHPIQYSPNSTSQSTQNDWPCSHNPYCDQRSLLLEHHATTAALTPGRRYLS